jgi:hypothetical protein
MVGTCVSVGRFKGRRAAIWSMAYVTDPHSFSPLSDASPSSTNPAIWPWSPPHRAPSPRQQRIADLLRRRQHRHRHPGRPILPFEQRRRPRPWAREVVELLDVHRPHLRRELLLTLPASHPAPRSRSGTRPHPGASSFRHHFCSNKAAGRSDVSVAQELRGCSHRSRPSPRVPPAAYVPQNVHRTLSSGPAGVAYRSSPGRSSQGWDTTSNNSSNGWKS